MILHLAIKTLLGALTLSALAGTVWLIGFWVNMSLDHRYFPDYSMFEIGLGVTMILIFTIGFIALSVFAFYVVGTEISRMVGI